MEHLDTIMLNLHCLQLEFVSQELLMRLLLVLLGLLIFLKISEYVHATIFLESLEKLVCFLLLVLLIFPLLSRFSWINWSLDINWLSVFLTEVRGNLGVINAFISQSLHSFLPSITI